MRVSDANPDQKRVLQNVAIAFHTSKRYSEALKYYKKRIELGLDSTTYSILKNAGLAALGRAGALEDEAALEEEMLDEEVDEEPIQASDQESDVNYYELAVEYMNQYLQHQPSDTTVLLRVANTYLYQLQNCTKGVSSFEKLLALSPKNCLAKKSIGYAYFGGVCTQDYTKAIRYLKDAYDCLTVGEGGCSARELAEAEAVKHFSRFLIRLAELDYAIGDADSSAPRSADPDPENDR